MRNLRSKDPAADEPGYKIPDGGGFRLVTCPQYPDEIISFIGMAMMVWNLGAIFVIAIDISNLVSRALYTHRWLKKNFEKYPETPKAITSSIL